jgi:hypothetical protein
VADGAYDPDAAERWLIAGIGGGAIANAEILLNDNSDAQVTMVGTTVPWVLENDAQHLPLRRAHDATMGGDGRLTIITGQRLSQLTTRTDPAGSFTFTAGGVNAQAYVACLGRIPRLPLALAGVQDWSRRSGGVTAGEVLFDEDRQYLGYRVTFAAADRTRCSVVVTGAASRMPPPDLFTADDIARVTQAGLHEAPPESGNVAAGFMAAAAQAARVSFPGPARAALAGAGPRPGSRTAAHDPRRRWPGPDVSGPTR